MKPHKILTALFLSLSFSLLSAEVVTTLFLDDFNRTSLNPEGQAIYTANSTTDIPIVENNMLKMKAPSAANTYGYGTVVGSLSSFDPNFDPKLLENEGLLTWRFNSRHNYNGRLTGFNSSRAMALVLLADGSDFSKANGYAIVQFHQSASSTNCYWTLVKFTGGLGNIEDIIAASNINIAPSGYRDFYSIKVTFDPVSKTWSLYDRNDGPSSGGGFVDSYLDTPEYTLEGSAVDEYLTALSEFSHFGFVVYASAGTIAWNTWYDKFGVTQTLSDPVGLHEIESKRNLWVNGSSLMLEVQDLAKVEIIAINGMIVQAQNIHNKGSLRLNKGQYIVRVTTEKETTIQKILIP